MNTALNFNTFSIVARCETTGELGVAVASAVPAVGSLCIYTRPNIGAVSTQSWVNPYLAIDVLDFIAAGQCAQTALNQALALDSDQGLRQIGIIDAAGRTATHTGENCTSWCGELAGNNFSVQGNMLANKEVLEAMSAAFQNHPIFMDALLAALKAGEAAGGDNRGKQSAALRIHAKEHYPLLDLRVDDHTDPIDELERILNVAKVQYLPFSRSLPARFGQSAGLSPDVRDVLMRSPQNRS